MRNAIMTIAALLGILVLSSCSKDNVKEETINGFNIQWEGELNKKQKDVIRLMIKDMVFVEGGDFQMGATAESDSMMNYDSEADCISITHDAHNRKGFALGAVLAAEFTATHSGLLTMDDLFDF